MVHVEALGERFEEFAAVHAEVCFGIDVIHCVGAEMTVIHGELAGLIALCGDRVILCGDRVAAAFKGEVGILGSDTVRRIADDIERAVAGKGRVDRAVDGRAVQIARVAADTVDRALGQVDGEGVAALGDDTGLIAAVDIHAVEDQLHVTLTGIDVDRAVKRTGQDIGAVLGDLEPSDGFIEVDALINGKRCNGAHGKD